MKKAGSKKLGIKSETIRSLGNPELNVAAGGGTSHGPGCPLTTAITCTQPGSYHKFTKHCGVTL